MGTGVRIPPSQHKSPGEMYMAWNRTSSELPIVRYGVPVGIHNRMCMERVSSLPTVAYWLRLASVVKLVDTLALGASAERCEGSSPS